MPQDLEVFSMCDHWQTPERSMAPTIYYIYPEDRDCYSDDEDWAEEYRYKLKVVML